MIYLSNVSSFWFILNSSYEHEFHLFQQFGKPPHIMSAFLWKPAWLSPSKIGFYHKENTVAKPVIGWLSFCFLPPAFVFARRHATVDALVADHFHHQLLTTALRWSHHQLPPTFAAAAIGWLLH
jgi:hypothetical protein